jgi:hypothetical protein
MKKDKRNLEKNKNKLLKNQSKLIDFLTPTLLLKHSTQLKFYLQQSNKISKRQLTNYKINYSIIWLIQMKVSKKMLSKIKSKAINI